MKLYFYTMSIFRHGDHISEVAGWYLWMVDQVGKIDKILFVGNMMQSVVLDGNPLDEDEDMRLLTCVVLDGNPPDEVMLDLMDLVNDVNLI